MNPGLTTGSGLWLPEMVLKLVVISVGYVKTLTVGDSSDRAGVIANQLGVYCIYSSISIC